MACILVCVGVSARNLWLAKLQLSADSQLSSEC